MNKPNLSQSLLKAYVDYYDENTNGCGVELRKRFFEKIPTPSSDAQKLGIYFEYMATGYHQENQPLPVAEIVYKGMPKEKMSVEYERATKSAMLFKEMISQHNIEIIKYGEYMCYEECSGISDIYAKWNGEDCIIDVKYTALFDDKFSEYGWHTESLPFKSKLLLQPIHYKWLIRKLKGIEDIPFYFFIFSSKDPEKVKIIKVNIQEEHINLHDEITIEKMKKYITFHFNNPSKLEARPSYLKCKQCSYFDNCEFKATVPLIEEVYY